MLFDACEFSSFARGTLIMGEPAFDFLKRSACPEASSLLGWQIENFITSLSRPGDESPVGQMPEL